MQRDGKHGRAQTGAGRSVMGVTLRQKTAHGRALAPQLVVTRVADLKAAARMLERIEVAIEAARMEISLALDDDGSEMPLDEYATLGDLLDDDTTKAEREYEEEARTDLEATERAHARFFGGAR